MEVVTFINAKCVVRAVQIRSAGLTTCAVCIFFCWALYYTLSLSDIGVWIG